MNPVDLVNISELQSITLYSTENSLEYYTLSIKSFRENCYISCAIALLKKLDSYRYFYGGDHSICSDCSSVSNEGSKKSYREILRMNPNLRKCIDASAICNCNPRPNETI